MYKDLRTPMSLGNRFTQLSNEAVENAAQLVLNQLSKRLDFWKDESSIDAEMECKQFGICSFQPQPNRVNL